MPQFKPFAKQINTQFDEMSKTQLFIMNVNKDEMWNFYLDSFPAGTNELTSAAEGARRHYDCQCCKQFIRNVGNVVTIVDGEIVTVWDVPAEGYYADVCKAMSEYIKSHEIKTIFLHEESKFGAETTTTLTPDNKIKNWNHYFIDLPARLVKQDHRTIKSKVESFLGVTKRGLNEITTGAIELAIELIEAGVVYRGDEKLASIKSFQSLKAKFSLHILISYVFYLLYALLIIFRCSCISYTLRSSNN